MNFRKFVGWSLLIIGPIFIVVFLGFCLFVAWYSSYSNPESKLYIYITSLAAIGLVIGSLSIWEGWLITHPSKCSRTRKPVGWLVMIISICGVGLSMAGLIIAVQALESDYYFYILFLLYFLFMSIGGRFLISSQRKRRHELSQSLSSSAQPIPTEKPHP